jgi:hypothetical protein
VTELILISAYECGACAVSGRDPAQKPLCWCCGQPARVIARVRSLPEDGTRAGAFAHLIRPEPVD